jgi:hypothetical protein
MKPSSEGPQKTPSTQKKSKVWDVVLLREGGGWEGFRAPETALRKTVNYIVLLFVLGSLSLVGWLWSRWELGRVETQYSQARLELRSTKAQLARLREGALKGENTALSEQLTFLPALDDNAVSSEDLSFKSVSLQYDSRGGELALDFEIEKPTRSALGSERLHWVLLLHGSQGVLSFPPSLVSRSGSWVHPQKGQLIEGLVRNRRVTARFRAQGFFEGSGIDPVYGTLLVYDHRGSLLIKQRSSVVMAQIKEGR